MTLRERLPALASKDYRLWFLGQGISVIGTWLQNTGQAWLVLKLTNSPFKLGLLSTIQYLPSLLLSLFIGPLLDRYPKRSILIVTQSLFSIAALILAALAFSPNVQYWHILAVAGFTGFLTAVDWPARQSFVVEQVGERSLVVNAVALNSTIFNVARVLGPAIGGVLIAAIGIPWTFLFNSGSYIAVITSLCFMKAGRNPRAKGGNFKGELRAGLSYIRKEKRIMLILIMIGFFSLFLMNLNILIPSFAKLTLGLSADRYGLLMSAMGFGSMMAGIIMSLSGEKLVPSPRLIVLAGFILAFAMVLTGLQKNFMLSAILLAACGFGMSSYATLCNTSVQILSTDEMRGRVMSAYNLLFVGSTPIGSLYCGLVSESFGVNAGFWLSGVLGLVFLAIVSFFILPRVFTSVSNLVLDSNKGENPSPPS